MQKPRERPKDLRTGMKPLPPREISYEQWIMRGNQLYGRDRRKWIFRCHACGHEQSIALAVTRPPHDERIKALYTPKLMADWIFFSCEGRYNDRFGCDWTLGGLFSGSRTAVKMPDGASVSVFEYAADPVERDYYYLPREYVLPMSAAAK
jgi:hypothetical protein